MQDTLSAISSEILLNAPNCPLPMAQNMVNRAYRKVLDSGEWSGLRKEAEFVVPAPYTTGTVTVTQGSPTVIGAGTTWTSAMEGRQFFVGNIAPYYTISSVGGVGTLTLDR